MKREYISLKLKQNRKEKKNQTTKKLPTFSIFFRLVTPYIMLKKKSQTIFWQLQLKPAIGPKKLKMPMKPGTS